MEEGLKIHSSSPGRTKVCIAIGHSNVVQGAVNCEGIHEFSFNEKLAYLVQWILKDRYNIVVDVMERRCEDYKEYCREFAKVAQLQYSIIYELHFNSAEVMASGAEFLCLPGSLGEAISNTFVKRFTKESWKMHGTGIKLVTKDDRGYDLFKEMNDLRITGVVIIEPCFGNNKEDPNYERTFGSDGKPYAALLAEHIFNIHFKDNK